MDTKIMHGSAYVAVSRREYALIKEAEFFGDDKEIDRLITRAKRRAAIRQLKDTKHE